MNRYWFKPKRYGFGATPATWEGWAATALVILGLLIEMQIIPARAPGDGKLLAVLAQLATVAAFVLLCWRKTDGAWRWRWGESG